ncbi:SRPBCC family protein [Ferrovibrio sp.]|jgi:uncharacterized protein YndB with AHSA1/START domain|uniref:SRPBCC family protein n=1 Tax=Ferrovibrio sp. TaxID=1917215 RepID=UPI0035AF124C
MNNLSMKHVIDNDAYGTVLESGAVRFQRLLPGPIERVWDYITDPEKRATWLAAGEMDLRVGGQVVLNFRNGDLAPKGEPVPERFQKYTGPIAHGGRITQLDPPRLLAMTWGESVNGGEAGCGTSSEVIFELTPRGKDVLLELTHRRLGSRSDMLSVSAGWHVHVAALIDQLHGRPVHSFWTMLDRLNKDYDRQLPA